MADPDFDVEFMGMRFNDPEVLRETLRRMEALVGASDNHAKALGNLCMGFAALDGKITRLYIPLLQCSEAQAACIADENISRRCAVAMKLLHLEDLPEDWLNWAVTLLGRANGELASLRNRFIHDSYHINADETLRIDRRARTGKPQSRQKTAVIYRTEHPTSAEELSRLEERVSTVSIALTAATQNLLSWRQTGQPPALDPQWLPASMPKARCLNYQALAEAPEQPLFPLEYEFD